MMGNGNRYHLSPFTLGGEIFHLEDFSLGL